MTDAGTQTDAGTEAGAAARRAGGRWGRPLAAAVLITAAAAWRLRAQGRAWLCESCERALVWTSEAWSSETSQHLFDPYSFTHVLHGIIFCGLLALTLRRLAPAWRFALAVALESAWEVIENTDAVIRRYREATAALGYAGDTVLNSLGDIAACAAGFLLARRLGLRLSIALLLLVEAALLLLIRDSLLLNVLLLVFPLDSVREWQQSR